MVIYLRIIPCNLNWFTSLLSADCHASRAEFPLDLAIQREHLEQLNSVNPNSRGVKAESRFVRNHGDFDDPTVRSVHFDFEELGVFQSALESACLDHAEIEPGISR